MDATTVAGILANADIGFTKLTLKLKNNFPLVTFQFGNFSGYYTEQIEKGVLDSRESYPEHAESHFLKDLLTDQ